MSRKWIRLIFKILGAVIVSFFLAGLLSALFLYRHNPVFWDHVFSRSVPLSAAARRGMGSFVLMLFLSLLFTALFLLLRGRMIQKSLLLLCLFLYLIWQGTLTVRKTAPLRNDLAEVRQVQALLLKEQIIVHAGGELQGPDGTLYHVTNSKEALQNCLDHDIPFIELDFRFTSDKKLVCTHDWKRMVLPNNTALTKKPSLADFLSCRVDGLFTPLSFEDVVHALREKENLYIITDVKDSKNISTCQMIDQTYPDLKDRFIVQIQHLWEYEPIRELGFRNIIFTLYETSDWERDPDKLARACNSHYLLTAITIPYRMSKDELAELPHMVCIPTCVHTIDKPATACKEFSNGFDVLYTNRLQLLQLTQQANS